MDTSVLKALLSSQEQAYRGAVEMLFQQVSDNVKSLQSTVNELTTSLEYTQKEVEELKEELVRCKQEKKNDEEEIKKLKEDLLNSDEKLKEIEERANYLEDYSRRNNLQIIGVQEALEGRTELDNARINVIALIARFAKYGDREAVMRNVMKLRGINIYFNEDFCPASQNIRKAQVPLMKQARSEGKVAFFRHTKLIIKDRTSTDVTSGGYAAAAATGGSTPHVSVSSDSVTQAHRGTGMGDEPAAVGRDSSAARWVAGAAGGPGATPVAGWGSSSGMGGGSTPAGRDSSVPRRNVAGAGESGETPVTARNDFPVVARGAMRGTATKKVLRSARGGR